MTEKSKAEWQKEMYNGKNVGPPPPKAEPLPWENLKQQAQELVAEHPEVKTPSLEFKRDFAFGNAGLEDETITREQVANVLRCTCAEFYNKNSDDPVCPLHGKHAVEKEPYLRWHKAIPDAGTMRGDNLDELNRRTLELIHERALQENEKDRLQFELKP